MPKLFSLSDLNWGAWLYGLFAGFIGGGAGAVTAGFTTAALDPTGRFAFGGWNSIKLMGACFLVSGLFNAFNFLKAHPLPDRSE